MTTSRANGFTLVELMIVAVVAVPILWAVLSTSERLGSTVNTNERNADASESVRRVAERTVRLLRAASRSTLCVRATQADVNAGKASVVGEWMSAPELDPRPNIQFQCASGTLSMNATSLTSPRELEFVIDANEDVNGTDDDGDGLVDEGKLFLRYGSTRVPIAVGVETCSFERDGQTVKFSVQCAKRDRSGHVHRVMVQQVVWVRNQ